MARTPPLSVPSRLRWPGLVAQAATSMGTYDVVAKNLVASYRLAFHGPPLSSAAQARERDPEVGLVTPNRLLLSDQGHW